jgi:hypothetical protein
VGRKSFTYFAGMSAIVSGLLTSASGAWAADPTVWQSVAFITATNGAASCTTGDLPVGGYFVTVYRPILNSTTQPGLR